MSQDNPASLESGLEQFLSAERLAKLDDVLAKRSDGLTVVLDGVHHPHNISAVIRSSDAFGIKTVHLIGQEATLTQGIAMGTERWIEVKTYKDPETALNRLREAGYRIVVTAPEDDSRASSIEEIQPKAVPVYQLPFSTRLALVFGNENSGVSPVLFGAAEFHAFIPMFGFVESLNISVACAISLFCSTISGAQRERVLPQLEDSQKEVLRNEWLIKGTNRAEEILREFRRREELSKD